MAVIAFFFCAGIVLASQIQRVGNAPPYLAGGVVLVLLAGLGFLFVKTSRRYMHLGTLALSALLLLLALALGGLHQRLSDMLPQNHVDFLPAVMPEVTLVGETRARMATASGRSQIILEVQRLYAFDEAHEVMGKIVATLDTTTATPAPGYIVLLRGRLLQPPGRCNPGEFDYDAYLQRMGVYRMLDVEALQVLSPAPGLIPGLRRRVFHLQQHIGRLIDRYVARASSRAVMRALILGDKSSLSDGTQHAFQQTGLSHVLAVSGLHVMLVGMLVYQLLGPVLLRLGLSWHTITWSRSVITLIVLGVYLLITGAKAPVCRAVLVAVLFIGGTFLQRPGAPVNALGGAALLLLLYRPGSLFEVGFQLSFLAVLSILVLLPLFSRMLPDQRDLSTLKKGLLQSVLVSVAATLGTMPVLLFHFGYLSFAGILLNIPALPLIAIALSAGLLMVAASYLTPILAPAFGSASDLLVNLLLSIVENGSRVFTFLAAAPGRISMQTVGLLVLVSLVPPALAAARYRWRLLIAGALCITAGLWYNVGTRFYAPQLSVVFFDVGHGDAALVRFPNGKHLLVDTGNQTVFVDQARRVILPYLARNGIKQLDAVLITHPHRDHAGGLPALLTRLPVARIVTTTVDSSLIATAYRPRQLPGNSQLPITTSAAGDTLLLDPAVRVRVLSPSPALARANNPNERSLVLQLQFGQSRLLLLGDIEREAEQFLGRYPALFLLCDLVKVAHHGSRTSSSASLLDRVVNADSAPLAVISTGQSSRYGLPDVEVLARWQARRADVHVTASAGALEIKSNGVEAWTTWSGVGCKSGRPSALETAQTGGH